MTNREYLLQSTKLQRAIEKKYIGPIAKDIQSQMNQAASFLYVMGARKVIELSALLMDKKPLTKDVSRLITEAGLRYAWLTNKDILRGLKPANNAQTKARLWGLNFDQWMRDFIKAYLDQSLPQIIQSITKTTSKRIAQILTDGLNQGKSVEDMASDLQKQGDYTRERAITIVRTEAISSQNALAIDNARRTGLKMNKVWLTQHDKAVRYIPRDEADHREADGQKVALDQPFMIATTKAGVVPMDYPGDKRKAPVEAWIKCRCTLRFEPVLDARGRPIRVAENAFRTG